MQILKQKKTNKEPNSHTIIENIGWLFFDKFIRMGVGLVVGVWIARYLGPNQFGLLNFVIALIGIFTVIAGLGLQSIVVRDIVRAGDTMHSILGTAAMLQVIGGLVAYILAICTVAMLRPEDQLAKVLVSIIGATLLIKACDFVSHWYESQVQSKYTIRIQNGAFLVFATIKVILILEEASIVTFAWMILAENVAAALVLLTYFHYKTLRLENLHYSKARAMKLLKESWPLIVSSMSIMIYMKTDQIMISLMINDKSAGIYTAAVRLTEIWYFIPITITASIFPAILRAHTRKKNLYNEGLQHLCDILLILSLIISLLISFLSKDIVNLIYGTEYIQAYPILTVYILGMIFVSMAVIGNNWYLTINRQDLALKRDLSGAVLNLMLNYFFIPHYGAIGAAYCTLFSYFITHLILDYFSKTTRELFYIKARSLNVFGGLIRLKRFQKAWI